MELLSVIRRWHLREQMSLREIARRTGLSRNTIKKYLRGNIVTPQYQSSPRPSKLSPFVDKLEHMLRIEANRNRKARRHVKAIFQDLVSLGYTGSYDRVIAHAKRWRAAQQLAAGIAGKGAYIPLVFKPGEAFQFDWSEDCAIINGERIKLQVAHFKLGYSRAFYLRAYPLQTHEMLFDAHNHAFEFFQGVPSRGIYDNMKTAVDKLGHGKQRTINARFAAMVSHFLFESTFCNPASGWEKGQVEKNVQDARHRLWHHAPAFNSLAELNAWLAMRCKTLWQETPHPEDRSQTIDTYWQIEREALMPRPAPFDGFIEYVKRVTPTCLVYFEQNRYSVPASFANRHVSLRIYADRLVIVAESQVIATHSRIINKHTRQSVTCYQWQHYLSVLIRKPGAIRNGAPFAELPKPLHMLQEILVKRPNGDKEMVEVLALVLHYDVETVIAAVAQSLAQGVASKTNILNLLQRMQLPESLPVLEPPSGLQIQVVPEANVERYEQLREARYVA